MSCLILKEMSEHVSLTDVSEKIVSNMNKYTKPGSLEVSLNIHFLPVELWVLCELFKKLEVKTIVLVMIIA